MAKRATVVCLCGSTRFKDAFDQAAHDETLAGRIVLSLGIFSKAQREALTGAQLHRQRLLHRQRIDMADEVLVINPGGYVGLDTANEVAYALAAGKRVRWLFDK